MKPLSPAARSAWAAAAVTLPVYWATMNRTIGFIDRGELAAVAATFGIPHPTGYPTLMLLAGALVRLVPLRPVLVLNALAAAFTAAGVAVLVLLFDRLLREAAPAIESRARAVYALLAALFTGFTLTWWQQANGFEVYALHALFMPLVVLLFLRWCDADAPVAPAAAAGRAGFAFALVTGLSFTNHLTTVLLAPGLLAAAVMRFGAGRALWRRVLPLAPPFVLGLLPYAWLPLRSHMNPRFDWGHVRTLREFLYHVSGADYRRWMFTDPRAMSQQLRYLEWRLPIDFAVIGIVLAALGMVLLARRAPRLAVLAGALLLAGVTFATGYAIPDIDAYLLTAVLGLAIAFAAGAAVLHERYGARVAVPLLAALVIVNAVAHRVECDESGNRMVEEFVHDVIGPLPPGAVLFTDLWENLLAPSMYFQAVEGFRRDIVVVSPRLTRKGWYLDELARRAPELVAAAGPAYADYRAALLASESRGVGSTAALEASRSAFLRAFAAGCLATHPVFTTGVPAVTRREWTQAPWRFAVWLRPDTAYVPEPATPRSFTPWSGHLDVYAAQTFQGRARARLDRARYEWAHGRPEAARRIVEEARAFDPGIHPERVGPQPLGFDQTILAVAWFFRDLRAADPLPSSPVR